VACGDGASGQLGATGVRHALTPRAVALDAQSNVVAVAAGATSSFALSGTSPQRFDAAIQRLDAQLARMLRDLVALDRLAGGSAALGAASTVRRARAGVVAAVLEAQTHLALLHYLRLAAMRGAHRAPTFSPVCLSACLPACQPACPPPPSLPSTAAR
jgi:hypothetical protein